VAVDVDAGADLERGDEAAVGGRLGHDHRDGGPRYWNSLFARFSRWFSVRGGWPT
jgi:hypothetical protein